MKFFWLILAFVLIGNIDGYMGMLIALGSIVYLVYFALQKYRDKQAKEKIKDATMAIQDFFNHHDKLILSDELSLKIIEPLIDDYRQLGVYLNDAYVSKLIDFKENEDYLDCFEKIDRRLHAIVSEGAMMDKNNNGIDNRDEKEGASYFLSRLYQEKQRFNEEEIRNGLHEIENLLMKIKDFEQRYPQIQPRLRKLYQHYLPMMLSILDQYANLKDKSANVEEVQNMRVKLEKTLFLVQEALKTLIATFVQDDVLNMNSDISVLEAILKRDGLVDDGLIKEGERHE